MYKLKLHKTLNKKKWLKFEQRDQLIMIGNELNRAKHWLNKHDLDEAMRAYERAFELLDLTISIIKNRKNKLKELLRFRELLGASYILRQKNVRTNMALYRVLLSLNKDSYAILNIQK